jgi:hypothetical protein
MQWLLFSADTVVDACESAAAARLNRDSDEQYDPSTLRIARDGAAEAARSLLRDLARAPEELRGVGLT